MRDRSARRARVLTQMTITRTATTALRMHARRLVIIAALLAGAARAAAPAGELTTVARATAARGPASAAPAAPLATVIVTGSSVYGQPQLFASYSDALGRPADRDGARAIAQAIAARYLRDGFVKPEVTVDDSQASQGI